MGMGIKECFCEGEFVITVVEDYEDYYVIEVNDEIILTLTKAEWEAINKFVINSMAFISENKNISVE
jgi:hypothetical protein